MNLLRTLPAHCPYPEQPHTAGCDQQTHAQLVAAVTDCVDPPIYRATAGDHTLCRLYPCADCR